MTHENTIMILSDLLDRERAALLKGDLDQVTGLLDPKQDLFEKIGSEMTSGTDELRDLDAKIKRNQLLLDGALDGIRTVAERMAALRQVQTSLDTYGADGLKKQIAFHPRSSVERRA